MSIRLVEQEIKRFLDDPTPEVICIMGLWGVGKTYTWNQYLKNAVSEKTVGLKHYSYVSLFGQNSLEGLKHAIFENTLPIEKIDDGVSVDGFANRIKEFSKKWRKSITILSWFPKTESYLSLVGGGMFLTVRNQLICIDDLERVSDSLSTKDVMGLVSFLKNQRKCKVVLLLNDEEMKEDGKQNFKAQLEKISDVEMHFQPTPQEAAQIGIDKTSSFYELLTKSTQSLGIVNIRVIRKIQRLLKRLEILLKDHDRRIFEGAIPSITLFGWAAYQPQLAPSIEYIKSFNPLHYLIKEKGEKESEEDKRLRLMINSTGFDHFDEFDQVLLESVEAGYFDNEKIKKAAEESDKKLQAQDHDNSFGAAWNKYHSSFADNQEEVLGDMYNAAIAGAKIVTPSNLDSVITLFRKLDHDRQADKIIKHYMNERSDEDKNFFDPKESIFLKLTDPSLKKAFEEKLASYRDVQVPEDVLFNIAKNGSWNPEDIETLANIAPEKYYDLFKKLNGDRLRIVVNQSLKFGKYTDADTPMLQISARAEQALKKIAKENPFNKIRVASYGVTPDDDDIDPKERLG